MEHSRVSSGLIPGFVHLRTSHPTLRTTAVLQPVVSAVGARHQSPPTLDTELQDVVVGSRVEILLTVEGQASKQHYPGTVTKIDRSRSPQVHHISYDDGDQEDLSLSEEDFKLIPAKVATEGAKLAPFWKTNLAARWERELEDVPPEERSSIVATMMRALADGSRNTYSSAQNQYIAFCANCLPCLVVQLQLCVS